MYPLEKIAIHVEMNVTVTSMMQESGSTGIVKLAWRLPAANHVTGLDTNWACSSPATFDSSTRASTADAPQATTSGQWAARRRTGLVANSAVTTVAASSRPRIVRASPV